MKKITLKIQKIFLMLLLALSFSGSCLAVGTPGEVMEDDTGQIKTLTEGSSVDVNQTHDSEFGTALLNLTHLIRNVLVGVGIGLICMFAVKILSSRKAIDDNVEKAKEGIKQVLTGLIGVLVLDGVVTGIYGTDGSAWTDQNTSEIQGNAEGIISIVHQLGNFIMSLAATIAVFIIVFSAVQMIFSFEDSGVIEKRKKAITVSMAGLMAMALSSAIFNKVIFGERVSSENGYVLSVQNGVYEILGITNYILGFVSFVAIGFLVYGGLRMITAHGDDGEVTKAKSIMINAIIGIVIAVMSYTLVVTFITP